ncbi:MAG: thioredoxin-dependent thiol peroxidase [Thermoproteota archaeon]|nr:thioredoxin-dependent thiol peroxidase [Thermoproteota archaeon]
MDENRIHEGDLAPDFSFSNSEGNKTSLHEMRGQRIVLYFYPKDFTPGCSTEASEFARDYEKFRAKEIEILGISPDDKESHSRFREKMNIPYPLLPDTDFSISKKYDVYGPKKFMGKEYIGVNRTTFLLDERGVIIKIFKRVKPLGHSAEVLLEFDKFTTEVSEV